MSVSKWAYTPDKCDYRPCPGDCDICSKEDIEYTIELISGALDTMDIVGNEREKLEQELALWQKILNKI